MSESQSCPYETRLNIFYKPLELVEEKVLSDECEYSVVQPNALPGERIGCTPGRRTRRISLAQA